jgi:hypothetical protein
MIDRPHEPRVQHAIQELQTLIQGRFPTASFTISRGEDAPENLHLITTVDIDDTDEVLDLVIDRVVELQVEEGIPIHVIPIRPPERVLTELQSPSPRRTGHLSRAFLLPRRE